MVVHAKGAGVRESQLQPRGDVHVYSFLCHQAGPMAKQPRGKLRLIHVPFEDDGFCAQMLDQISCHLEAVSPNWRETHYMSTLLILVLRVCTLGSRRSARGTLRVLEKIRRISLEWIRVLRQEVRHARDSDHARHAMSYALASALICKRTFFFGYQNQTVYLRRRLSQLFH